MLFGGRDLHYRFIVVAFFACVGKAPPAAKMLNFGLGQ